MREIIPSQSMIYTIVGLLLVIMLVAILSLYINFNNKDTYRRTLFWTKLLISLPLLYIGIRWMIFATTGFGVAALSGSTLRLNLVLLTLAPILIYILITWGLIRWIRNKRFANVSIIIGIISFASIFYAFKREWIHSIL